MEFKSQICTTKEQSDRLLALGLKKETADMMYITDGRVPEEYRHYDIVTECYESCLEDIVYIPAWSLHRLMEIIQNNEKEVSHILDREDLVIEWFDDGGWKNKFFRHIENTYDRMIYCIEYMLKEGLINPEYLEEQK